MQSTNKNDSSNLAPRGCGNTRNCASASCGQSSCGQSSCGQSSCGQSSCAPVCAPACGSSSCYVEPPCCPIVPPVICQPIVKYIRPPCRASEQAVYPVVQIDATNNFGSKSCLLGQSMFPSNPCCPGTLIPPTWSTISSNNIACPTTIERIGLLCPDLSNTYTNQNSNVKPLVYARGLALLLQPQGVQGCVVGIQVKATIHGIESNLNTTLVPSTITSAPIATTRTYYNTQPVAAIGPGCPVLAMITFDDLSLPAAPTQPGILNNQVWYNFTNAIDSTGQTAVADISITYCLAGQE